MVTSQLLTSLKWPKTHLCTCIHTNAEHDKCSCSLLLSDNAPADPTSAQTPASVWVQQPRGWFHSSQWKQAVAGCCPLRRYGGSYGQQICPHTLTHIHHLGTHELKHCGYHAERKPELRRDNSSHYGLILYCCFSTRMHENNKKYHIHCYYSQGQREWAKQQRNKKI